MTTVLYADVLFIINFSMDFISLWLTAKMLALDHRLWRYICAAALGALAATTMTAYSVGGALGAVLTLILSVAMCLTAYGFGSIRRLILRSMSLWGAGALVGGMVSAICSLGERAVLSDTIGESSRPWGVIALGVLAAWAIVRAIRPHLSRKSATVRLTVAGRTITCEALVDSGNLARDPTSGDSVIFLSAALGRSLVGERAARSLVLSDVEHIPTPLKTGLRLIPISGIGASSLCAAIRADRVDVLPDRAFVRALVAFVDVPSDHFGGCGALLPSALI